MDRELIKQLFIIHNQILIMRNPDLFFIITLPWFNMKII